MRYRYDTGSIIDTQTGEILTDITIRNRLNKQEQELQHIKNTIKEQYNNERTQIGKNTLKQLIEAIQ
jgi:hypothetical protein